MPFPYATAREFYDYLKAEAIVCSPRRVEAVDAATNRLLIPGHGLVSGDVGRIELGADGYGGTPAYPSPLGGFTPYYVLVAGSDLIALSATSGGSAIDITTTGSGLLSFVLDMEASILRHITQQAARVDSCLAARGVELPLAGDWPALTSLVIRLAVWPVLLARGYTSGRQVDPDQDYKVLWEAAEEELKDLCAGKPAPGFGDLPIAAGSTLASVWDSNRRGWTPDTAEEGI